MADNQWVHGSGRSGKPRPPSKGKKMKCPKCKQEVQVYGIEIERHKIYVVKNGKKTSAWSWCPQKTVN